MWHNKIGRRPHSIPQAGGAAGLSMIGVFPRHSTLIFREALAVISLALALGLLVLAVTVLAPRSAWPQTTMDPAQTKPGRPGCSSAAGAATPFWKRPA